MKHYENNKEEMILRDFLAVDRTDLANERTLLAYMRTFIGLLVSGVGLIKFVDDPLLVVIGYCLSVISPFVLVLGLYRFLRIRIKIKKIKND